MSYYVWIFINVLFINVSALYIWMVRPYDSSVVLIGKLFAQFAIILFLINVNMYFISCHKKVKSTEIKSFLKQIVTENDESAYSDRIIGNKSYCDSCGDNTY
jgi:hypothetical protein